MRQLGQLEAVVMERLWSYDRPLTVREVLDDVRQDRTIAYTTVMTVMANLHRKGLLSRELHGSAYRYLPAQSREQYSAVLMGQILAGSSDRAATLLQFLEQMTPDEVARLRKALQQRLPSSRGRRR